MFSQLLEWHTFVEVWSLRPCKFAHLHIGMLLIRHGCVTSFYFIALLYGERVIREDGDAFLSWHSELALVDGLDRASVRWKRLLK